MKKNYLLGMFAATGMLLATSCSNDELEVAQSGNEAQVTFSLGLENGIGAVLSVMVLRLTNWCMRFTNWMKRRLLFCRR